MAAVERFREEVSGPPTPEEIERRGAEGWTLAAVVWQREVTAGKAGAEPGETAEAPYGVRAPDGGTELLTHHGEEEALRLILAMVIDDRYTPARVAEELNRRGLHTRDGGHWNQTDVFNMMPRLVEVAPRLYSSREWQEVRSAVLS